jgi:hypothetical protein
MEKSNTVRGMLYLLQSTEEKEVMLVTLSLIFPATG